MSDKIRTHTETWWEIRNAAGEAVYTYFDEEEARTVFTTGPRWMLLPGDYLVEVTKTTTTTITSEEIDV